MIGMPEVMCPQLFYECFSATKKDLEGRTVIWLDAHNLVLERQIKLIIKLTCVSLIVLLLDIKMWN